MKKNTGSKTLQVLIKTRQQESAEGTECYTRTNYQLLSAR